MKLVATRYGFLLGLLSIMAVLVCHPVVAGGLIGDHVNHLSDNLDKYNEEVNWLIKKVDGIVGRYAAEGVKAAKAETVVDHWEAVDFHDAIETNYVPVYAMIWQGLFGVKDSIEQKAAIAIVREEQRKLEQALWQALGAVKLAAQYQERGLLAKIQVTETGSITPIATLDEIKMRLDRVVAKYAEKVVKESVSLVHDTYLNMFEGVEGELISLDAPLVEDLEKDFNVTLPKALQANASVDEVRKIVIAMRNKLDKAKSLLQKANQDKKDVF